MTKPVVRRRGRRSRGYALLFVIVLGLMMSMVVAGVFDLLAEHGRTSALHAEELQQLHGCEGALRLARAALPEDPNADVSQIQARLGLLAAQLRQDRREGTGVPYADLQSITVVPTQVGELPITRFPFEGMSHVAEASEFVVTPDPTTSRGRTCRGETPNQRRTMSLFQFAAVSHQRLSERFTDNLGAGAGTTGEVATLQESLVIGGGKLSHELEGDREDIANRQQREERRGFTVRHIHMADFQGFRPVAPAGWVWSQVVLWRRVSPSRGNGGIRNRPSYKPLSMEYFLKTPELAWRKSAEDAPISDPTFSRFALQADVRIVDGEWFVANRAGAYPGKRVWSDRPGPRGRQVLSPVLYSDYEEVAGQMSSGGAVVRYGAAVPSEGSDPLPLASRGFFDPYRHSDGTSTSILPIVFDVGAFGAALLQTGPRELGTHRCIDDHDDVRCTDANRFRGAIWIGTTPLGRVPDALAPRGTPCPLVDPGIDECVRPNAVVLKNAGDLSLFVRTGLSIGSNLPLYVIGGVNDRTPDALRTSKVALMAPVITVLSDDADLETIDWTKSQRESLPRSDTVVTLEASIFTAWASEDPNRRDPARDLLRRLQPDLRVRLVGSAVAMFTRARYALLRPAETGRPDGLDAEAVYGTIRDDSDYAGLMGGSGGRANGVDPETVALPLFIPNGDNPAELDGERLAPTVISFPGQATRDLRRAAFEHQPPASPRLSLIPEAPDWSTVGGGQP
jgi:hypothetical protein